MRGFWIVLVLLSVFVMVPLAVAAGPCPGGACIVVPLSERATLPPRVVLTVPATAIVAPPAVAVRIGQPAAPLRRALFGCPRLRVIVQLTR